jgi:hypothetical protein
LLWVRFVGGLAPTVQLGRRGPHRGRTGGVAGGLSSGLADTFRVRACGSHPGHSPNGTLHLIVVRGVPGFYPNPRSYHRPPTRHRSGTADPDCNKLLLLLRVGGFDYTILRYVRAKEILMISVHRAGRYNPWFQNCARQSSEVSRITKTVTAAASQSWRIH